MPFIDVRSSGEITEGAEAELKAELGKAISLIPGKSEESLMMQFSDGCRLWFAGEQGSRENVIIMVNVMVYGSAEKKYYKSFADAVKPVLNEKLNAKKVYLKFEEVPNWF